MGARWRAALTATVVAVSATTALATVVRAEPVPAGVEASLTTGGASAAAARHAAAAAPPAPRLAPVSVHPVDPALLAAVATRPGGGSGQTVTQTIQLTIIGGDLELATEGASVTLHPVEGSDREWAGTLPAVRVIDARGTGEGWTVRWRLADLEVDGAAAARSLPDARVRVEPDAPVVVDGLPDGLRAGNGAVAGGRGRTLFSAAAGSGGGTYEGGATVSVRLPQRLDADSVVVELAFAVS